MCPLGQKSKGLSWIQRVIKQSRLDTQQDVVILWTQMHKSDPVQSLALSIE